MTPLRDSHFTTHIHDPRFATHVSRLHFRDSRPRLTLATHISDSRSRLHSRLTFATPDRAPNCNLLFLSQLPSCDSTTDRRSVLAPQRHLTSLPTLTLTEKILEPSPWPGLYLKLLPTIMSTTPSGLVSPDTPSGPLPPAEASTPPPPLSGPLTISPPLSPPLPLPPSLLYGNMSFQF